MRNYLLTFLIICLTAKRGASQVSFGSVPDYGDEGSQVSPDSKPAYEDYSYSPDDYGDYFDQDRDTFYPGLQFDEYDPIKEQGNNVVRNAITFAARYKNNAAYIEEERIIYEIYGDKTKCNSLDRNVGTCKPLLICPTLLSQAVENPSTSLLRKFEGLSCNRTAHTTNFCCARSSNDPGVVPPPILGNCGITVGDKIVGGTPVKPGQYPWLVIVGRPSGGNDGVFFTSCTGTLVSDRHVISAAHCFNGGSSSHVRLGEHDVLDKSDNIFVEDIRIQSLERNGYNKNNQENDIIIITLSQKVKYNSRIFPICLPSGRYEKEDFVGQTVINAGWGRSSPNPGSRTSPVLLEALMPVQPLSECDRRYSWSVDHRNLCAGKDPISSCSGDSGGPLMTENKSTGRYHLVGVTSYGDARCGRSPGVYTRVGYHMNWIRRHITV